jgi:hypothetical protein
MLTNLAAMRKIAWTNNHPRKENAIKTEIIEVTPKGVIKFEPRNYCDNDLSELFDAKDWFEDTWWKSS